MLNSVSSKLQICFLFLTGVSLEFLFELSGHPYFIAMMVFAISWLWEDAAVISGALLAVEQKLSIPLAVSVVFLGITTGDLALYYLGRLAHRWRGLRGWLMLKPQCRYMSKRFHKKTLFNILMIRFIPGLRTVGFTLCGLWKVSFMRFFLAMAVAGAIWVTLVFSGVYQLGSAAFFEDSHWKWSLMSIALFLLVFNNAWSYYRNKANGG